MTIGRAVVVAMTLMSACASERYSRVMIFPYSVTRDEMFAAAETVLEKRGKKLRVVDAGAGIIETEWIVVDGKYGMVEAWRVVIFDEQLRLTERCEMVGDATTTRCVDDAGRTARFDHDEPILRAAIVTEANRRAGRNPNRFHHMPYGRTYTGTE